MDNKINWKQKLTSRKFWALIVGFITPLLLSFGITESAVSQTTAIIMAGGAVIAYILGEGFIDANREQIIEEYQVGDGKLTATPSGVSGKINGGTVGKIGYMTIKNGLVYDSEGSVFDNMEDYDSVTTAVTDGENVSEVTTTTESITSNLIGK